MSSKLIVALCTAAFFQQVIAAQAQSRPPLDVQQHHFGMLSLRATPGKGKIEGQRYWLYFNRKIVARVGGGAQDSVAFLPIDRSLTPGKYIVTIVTYDKDMSFGWPGFCVTEWRGTTGIPIEAGKVTKFTIDGVPSSSPDFPPSVDAAVTVEDGKSEIFPAQGICSRGEFPWEAPLVPPPSRENVNWLKEEVRKKVDGYNEDWLVGWARKTLRSLPNPPYAALPNPHPEIFAENTGLWGYEVDGFQLRVLFDRLKRQYGLDQYILLAYENRLAAVPLDLRPAYRELARYIALIRADVQKEMQSFYSIADALDRDANLSWPAPGSVDTRLS